MTIRSNEEETRRLEKKLKSRIVCYTFIEAAKTVDIDSMSATLLDQDTDTKNHALHWASRNGHLETVKLLIRAGADINSGCSYALQCATYSGHTEIVKFLLESGAIINGNDSLRWACERDFTEIAGLLLHPQKSGYQQEGANVRAENDHVLRQAVDFDRPEMVKLLVGAGANIHALNDYALRISSRDGRTGTVKFLVKAGANVHAENENALRQASMNGHTEIVKLLVEAGANVHVFGENPLLLAAENGHVEIVKLLIVHVGYISLHSGFLEFPYGTIGVSKETPRGLCPRDPCNGSRDIAGHVLVLVSMKGFVEIVRFLVDEAEVRIDYNKDDSLFRSLSNQQYDVVEFLISRYISQKLELRNAFFALVPHAKIARAREQLVLLVVENPLLLDLLDFDLSLKYIICNELLKRENAAITFVAEQIQSRKNPLVRFLLRVMATMTRQKSKF